jgi:hypothetical protein
MDGGGANFALQLRWQNKKAPELCHVYKLEESSVTITRSRTHDTAFDVSNLLTLVLAPIHWHWCVGHALPQWGRRPQERAHSSSQLANIKPPRLLQVVQVYVLSAACRWG